PTPATTNPDPPSPRLRRTSNPDNVHLSRTRRSTSTRTITRKTWTRWLLLLLLALLAGWGAWRWVTRPETMRLVARFPVEERVILHCADDGIPALFNKAGGLYVRAERSLKPHGPTTLTLMDWENTPRWQVTAPLRAIVDVESSNPGVLGGKYKYSWISEAEVKHANALISTIALSPDGRVFTLAQFEDGHTMTVRSWHDGASLGVARVPLPMPRSARRCYYRYCIQVTNSGRVWLYDEPPIMDRTCRLWMIDGARVARGSYTVAFRGGFNCTLSPGGGHLLCYQEGAQLEYVMLTVAGNQVRAARRYTIPIANEAYRWLDDDWALGDSTQSVRDGLKQEEFNIVIGLNGVLIRAPEEALRLSSPEQEWAIRTNRAITVQDVSVDQRTVLVWEHHLRLSSRFAAQLQHVPLLKMIYWPTSRWSVYTDPGRQRAVLPSSAMHNAQAGPKLSPDGRRVAYMMRQPGGSYEIRVYAWGKPK
ncbi:MAG: TolB-like translocation protein, partial [Armatimonadota bacterium]